MGFNRTHENLMSGHFERVVWRKSASSRLLWLPREIPDKYFQIPISNVQPFKLRITCDILKDSSFNVQSPVSLLCLSYLEVISNLTMCFPYAIFICAILKYSWEDCWRQFNSSTFPLSFARTQEEISIFLLDVPKGLFSRVCRCLVRSLFLAPFKGDGF